MVLKWISPWHLGQQGKKELDYVGYAIIFLSLAFTAPQVMMIFENESAEDVSLITWVGYTILGFWWLFYGIERGVKPIILSSLLHIGVDVIVVYGIVQFQGIQLVL